ncbi:MAG: hypothetical protein BWY85_00118 [Firmicutes bacterium ADurb.Bin506]|nr:MAG: hypothetical protein BWY85_00118 [Firmicutes bacterium ADurb.Bin506]
MAKVNFDLTNASPEFRKGFIAALAFFDGVPQGEASISHDFTDKSKAHTGITFDDGGDNDNVTYKVKRGKLVADSIGVER